MFIKKINCHVIMFLFTGDLVGAVMNLEGRVTDLQEQLIASHRRGQGQCFKSKIFWMFIVKFWNPTLRLYTNSYTKSTIFHPKTVSKSGKTDNFRIWCGATQFHLHVVWANFLEPVTNVTMDFWAQYKVKLTFIVLICNMTDKHRCPLRIV